ncbi:exported hypothetical protein [Xanthomonas phaseoli pv. phaseoli]|uniref:Uncharacterized protein n=1 Tax=Xanthomonas campestris pv. phaseoli TaxID=317013 RepID=A0A7Z7J543_XANCH|nr:exported hypothetical protein [Xanthomonas phaseoli pv. phaseoli]
MSAAVLSAVLGCTARADEAPGRERIARGGVSITGRAGCPHRRRALPAGTTALIQAHWPNRVAAPPCTAAAGESEKTRGAAR